MFIFIPNSNVYLFRVKITNYTNIQCISFFASQIMLISYAYSTLQYYITLNMIHNIYCNKAKGDIFHVLITLTISGDYDVNIYLSNSLYRQAINFAYQFSLINQIELNLNWKTFHNYWNAYISLCPFAMNSIYLSFVISKYTYTWSNVINIMAMHMYRKISIFDVMYIMFAFI